MFFNGWMLKETVAHPHRGAPLSLKVHSAIWMDLQGITLSEKSQFLKGYIPYDSICKIFVKGQNYRDGEHISGYQEIGRLGVGGRCDILTMEVLAIFPGVVGTHIYM